MTAAAEWDGMPESPEKDGVHWVRLFGDDEPTAILWYAKPRAWTDLGGAGWPPRAYANAAEYLGPCITPAHHAADLRAAAEAVRANDVALILEWSREKGIKGLVVSTLHHAATHLSQAALPLPTTPALAEHDRHVEADELPGLDLAIAECAAEIEEWRVEMPTHVDARHAMIVIKKRLQAKASALRARARGTEG